MPKNRSGNGPQRPVASPDAERGVEPKPALGVKIVVGIAAGALVLLALGIWAIVKVLAP